jgi:prepilin-type N-terminal cleavage/methylation domain-containing protein
MPRSRGTAGGAGFTLIEVLVVVAIIGLLIAVLLPSLKQARELAQRAACGSGAHQLSVGLQSYAAAHKGRYPYGLAWPCAPFGPPLYGTYNPRTQFNTQDSGVYYTGYPAYIALHKLKHTPDPDIFYCAAQKVLRRGGAFSWPSEPMTIAEAQATGRPENAYRNYVIGYSWYADFWMSKDAYNPTATANFPDWMKDYPDNWWAHGMGRRNGKRQVLADRMDDPSRMVLVSDIMQDYRGYQDVLGTDRPVKWSARPDLSLNSHGGPANFVGGNVAYNDGSVRWRKRVNCEADFRRSFEAHNGYNTWEPQFQYMLVNHGSQTLFPGSGTVYNLYW